MKLFGEESVPLSASGDGGRTSDSRQIGKTKKWKSLACQFQSLKSNQAVCCKRDMEIPGVFGIQSERLRISNQKLDLWR